MKVGRELYSMCDYVLDLKFPDAMRFATELHTFTTSQERTPTDIAGFLFTLAEKMKQEYLAQHVKKES